MRFGRKEKRKNTNEQPKHHVLFDALGKLCEFNRRRVCLDPDQVFAVRWVLEKYVTYGKNMFWKFIDLEMTCNLINWNTFASVS